MATETFTWQRQRGAAGRITYRILESKFGDGYAQVIPDGLNTEVQSWPLTFEGGLDDMKQILDFFKRHRGAKSFYWTPPGESQPLFFRADDVTFTSVGGGVHQVSAEFKQVFYP